MTERYTHYMLPAAGGQWPSQVIAVGVTASWDQQNVSGAARRERLLSWQAICLRKHGERYHQVCAYAGATPTAFWKTVYDYAQHGGTTWFVSQHCPRVWALLQLWEEIEGERLHLVGRDIGRATVDAEELSGVRSRAGLPESNEPTGLLHRLRRRTVGYLVLEDPPCILRAKPAGRPGWIAWVDTRNYGLTAPVDRQSPSQSSLWIAEWFMAFHQAAQDYGLGSLQATAGSQAMHAFRSHYLKDTIYVHNNRSALGLEREGYYGGRCEAFRLGLADAPLWHVDFRSQYGAVCAATSLPVRLCHYHASGGGPGADRALRSGRAIAAVTVRTEEPAYPVERDGLVIWPVGEFRTALAGPELTDALLRGRIVDCHAVAEYELEPALAHYARSLYRLRCEAEVKCLVPLASLAKALLVSLPGKLGQRSRYWELDPEVWFDEPYYQGWTKNEQGEWERQRMVAWVGYRERCGDFSADAVPAMAAWITSEARVRLLDAIRTAGWDHVWYVDTDSLVVDAIGYGNLAVADNSDQVGLGGLYRKSGPVSWECFGVKHYREDEKIVCAGLPKGECVDAGDGRHYWYHRSPAYAIREGERPAAEAVLKSYERHEPYQHGQVLPDGRVRPWRLP